MEAFIFDAVRTPRGKGKKDGGLHAVTPLELAATLLRALRERHQRDTALVDDVVLGCVTPIGEQGACTGQLAPLAADYDESVAGVEAMSRVPMGSDGGAWPVDPRAAIKHYFTSQGVSADVIATCACLKAAASPWPWRCPAPPWAAAWRLRWPVITAWRLTTPKPALACLKSRWACCPAAAPSACRA